VKKGSEERREMKTVGQWRKEKKAEK